MKRAETSFVEGTGSSKSAELEEAIHMLRAAMPRWVTSPLAPRLETPECEGRMQLTVGAALEEMDGLLILSFVLGCIPSNWTLPACVLRSFSRL